MEEKMKNGKKILIVDDSEMNREILIDILENEFDILEASNGLEGVKMLKKYNIDIALVLLDIVMPEMDGFEVLAIMNKYHWIDDIPVVMISAENSTSYIERAYELGVTDFIGRPFDANVVYRRVHNTIMLYEKQNKLVKMVTDQIYEKEKRSNLMIGILSHVVEVRNGESGLHVLHVQTITEILLKHLAQKSTSYHLTKEQISMISLASALHDIGKIAIDEKILNKPGKFTDEEYAIMKTHATIGASMLEELPMYNDEKMVSIAREICHWHHERYDGRGYPDGLKGEEIPISAQVVAVADVYDALVSPRVYKSAFSHEDALKMIANGECGAFNPLLLECLQEVAPKLKEELAITSAVRNTEKEIYSIIDQIHEHSELSVSEKTIESLEYERSKNRFFAIMSDEIQFEYTRDPSTLIIDEWGVKTLGIDEVTLNPLEDVKIKNCVGENNLNKILKKLHNTSPRHTDIELDCKININGKKRWCRIVARTVWKTEKSERYEKFFGKIRDIHDTMTEISNLKEQAAHDELTGLLNRVVAKETIKNRIQTNPYEKYAMIIFDIDHFKSINVHYGHIYGDEILKQVASVLFESIRDNDVAARVGGDEFMFFLQYKDNNLEEIIDRIFHSLTGKYEDIDVFVSMGIATSIDVGTDYQTLFHCADTALYAAKNNGRHQYCFYDHSMKDLL